MYKRMTAFAALCLIGGPVLAGTPALNARQQHERARIAEGVRTGELTRAETRRLARGQAHLQRMENLAKSDGVVTPAERARLGHVASVQSRRIYVQKHDSQNRH